MKNTVHFGILAVGSLLAAGRFVHADPSDEEKELREARHHCAAKEYDKAMACFDKMIGPTVGKKGSAPSSKEQGWAYSRLEIRKEKALLAEKIAEAAPLDDRLNKWGEAVAEWISIQRTFALRLYPAPNAKRALYFDLFIAQKRCSALAYKRLGSVAFPRSLNPEESLQEKFSQLTKQLADLRSINPDLTEQMRTQISEIVDLIEDPKSEDK